MAQERFGEFRYFKLDILQIYLHLFTFVDCTTYNALNIQSMNITQAGHSLSGIEFNC